MRRKDWGFSDSQEETACLGPRCCGFQTPVSGELIFLCVAVCLQLPDSLRLARGQSRERPEAVSRAPAVGRRTQSLRDGALWLASPWQHQQHQRGLSLGSRGP